MIIVTSGYFNFNADMKIKDTIDKIRAYFYTNQTRNPDFRIEQLKMLKETVIKYKSEIQKALYYDLHKSPAETMLTEIGIVLNEIDFAVKNLKEWAKTEEVETVPYLKPAKSLIVKEPFGIALIIVPFNYPLQLALTPLVGAIAAGNCAVIRTSHRTPETSKVLNQIISETFTSDYIKMFLPEEISSKDIMQGDFDYIFFTGSTQAGRQIAKTAGERLIPYTLELGGKSPVIIDDTADLKVSARRIVKGKFMNAGQTCIAPDYLFVHASIREKLILEMINAIQEFYGTYTQESTDYGRIIDIEAFNRLSKLIKSSKDKIIYGGHSDECTLYIEPTLIVEDSVNSDIMQEEIFGPLLPVLEWTDINRVKEYIRQKPKPLALYVFSEDKEFRKDIFKSLSFGGGAVNDTINHTAGENLPFGGVGASGVGRYHGKYSFYTFSHLKSVLISSTERKDDIFCPPFTKEKINLINRFY